MAKVSVVTVVRNGESFIRATMDSVLNQLVPPDEYVIWDGLSTDRTLEIIAEYNNPLVRVISKKDNGPYDAMNLAVGQCTGEWVIFMNCGDEFARPGVLKDAMPYFDANCDIIYGGCIKVFPFGEREQDPGTVTDLWKSTIFWHQSVFVRKSLQTSIPFDRRYTVCADYDFTWKAFRQGARFQRLGVIVSRVITGGISEVHEFKGIYERYIITRRDIPVRAALMFVNHALKYALRVLMKRALPDAVVHRIQLSRKVSS